MNESNSFGMKKNLGIIFLFFTITAFTQKPVPKSISPPPIKLKSAQDSLQYALGVYMGNYMFRGGFTSINLDFFLSGVNDVFKSNPKLIPDSIVLPMINNYQSATQKQRGKFLEEQLFSALKDKSGMGKLPSGVQYSIIKPGKGSRPLDSDTIIIRIKGTLPDGTVFQNTFLQNTPDTTTPDQLIPGLSEALQLMQPGATWLVFIPSSLAYGDKGTSIIPPNSALLITVELVEIKGKK